jgi:hypothetical protein
VLQTRALALGRFARTEEEALFAAILALLVAGIVAAVLLPTQTTERALEHGSLVAPPSDSGFTQDLAAPNDPTAALGGSGTAGAPTEPRSPGSPNSPSKPAPPKPSPPEPPPDDDGLLPDLPIIPPPPLLAEQLLAELLQPPR